ncbi:MAG: DUF4349 domain-containing protein [Chloroflexota bacterium]|jgi:hypothetical protein
MRRISVMALLMFLLVACGGASSADSYDVSMGAPMEAPAAEPAVGYTEEMSYEKGAMPAVENSGTSSSGVASPLTPGERLIVRDASLTIEVDDVQKADQEIRALVDATGGYVLSSSAAGSDAETVIYASLKIPSEKLDSVITAVERLAHKVIYRSMSGSDVTEEYVDLEARLASLEAARDRLLALLEKAANVEEAVQVNAALTDVQTQLEQITGRMRYLRQGAAMSSLNLELRPIPVTEVIDPDRWQPLEDARIALRDLIQFGQDIISFVIGLAVWTPVWLPLVLLGRYLWRRRAARKAASVTPPTNIDPPASA